MPLGPRFHNLLDVEIEETVFETHVGGNIYDRGVDGSECRWARVLVCEPRTDSSSAGTSAREGNWKQTPKGWEAQSNGGGGGWPLYRSRYAEISAESPGATARR
jgi:hypothetical protein